MVMVKMNQIAKSEEYRETELGELPVDWEIKTIKEIGTVVTGRTPSTKVKEYYGSDYMFIAPADLDQGKYVKKSQKLLSKKGLDVSRPLPKKTILVGCIGTIGKTAMTSENNCTTNQQINAIISNDNVSADYIYYVMVCFGPNLSSLSGKVTIPIVNKSNFEQFKIPLPPLPEQQKIAYVLSAIQEDKEKTENIINSYKELKKSLMKHLFKYGPVKFEDAEKVKLKETEIGEIPENWDVKEIKNLIEKTKQKDMRKEDTEFKYIDVSSIDRYFYRITGFTLHKGETSPSRARKIVKTDDVIVATVRPTLKRIALVSEDYDNQICSTAFCVLRANKEQLSSKYLYYSVQRSLFFDALSSIQRGASYPAVSDSDIKKQKIVYPNPACQEEIAEILSSVDSKIEQEENKKQALEELFKSMLHNLMTAKIRVKDIEVLKWKN